MIIVLSAGSPLLARKLAKLLAADPLFQPDDWEKSLEDETVNTGKAILIRYGPFSHRGISYKLC